MNNFLCNKYTLINIVSMLDEVNEVCVVLKLTVSRPVLSALNIRRNRRLWHRISRDAIGSLLRVPTVCAKDRALPENKEKHNYLFVHHFSTKNVEAAILRPFQFIII